MAKLIITKNTTRKQIAHIVEEKMSFGNVTRCGLYILHEETRIVVPSDFIHTNIRMCKICDKRQETGAE